jgi:hypothetical protein
MDLCAMIYYMPSFVKIGLGIQKLIGGGRGYTHRMEIA